MTHIPIDLNLKVGKTLGSPGYSSHELYRSLGLDYEEELKKIKQEKIKLIKVTRGKYNEPPLENFNPNGIYINQEEEANHEGMVYNPYSNKWSYL